jgi:hypothetical protein
MLREKRLTRKALAFLLVILLFWSCFSVAASACSTIQAKKNVRQIVDQVVIVENITKFGMTYLCNTELTMQEKKQNF